MSRHKTRPPAFQSRSRSLPSIIPDRSADQLDYITRRLGVAPPSAEVLHDLSDVANIYLDAKSRATEEGEEQRAPPPLARE